jgi:hypothetical protein
MRRTLWSFLLCCLLILMAVMPVAAQEAPRASVRFAWSQPLVTTTGSPQADGWMKEYRIYVATDQHPAVYYGKVAAPTVLADSCVAYVSLEIGVPSTVQVEGVNRWDVVGPVRSSWSDTVIVIPDPPASPGTPQARR